uniref:Uncharacterized protein n=1 Tax=Noctiluca scintillans TaxID=2966 RepID=A0A7S1EZ53_NOCSC
MAQVASSLLNVGLRVLVLERMTADDEGERDCQSFRVVLHREGLWWMIGSHAARRNLVLPSGATVGMARRCFGRPLLGTARALVPSKEVPSQTTGSPRWPCEVADDQSLWEVSRQCRAELSFSPAPPTESALVKDILHALDTPRRLWNVVRTAWGQYRPKE